VCIVKDRNRLHIDDISDWFDELGLQRRKNALRKNISAAVADAVVVAEIVHTYYPKLVQVRMTQTQ
jgi:hypothetical protein